MLKCSWETKSLKDIKASTTCIQSVSAFCGCYQVFYTICISWLGQRPDLNQLWHAWWSLWALELPQKHVRWCVKDQKYCHIPFLKAGMHVLSSCCSGADYRNMTLREKRAVIHLPYSFCFSFTSDLIKTVYMSVLYCKNVKDLDTWDQTV